MRPDGICKITVAEYDELERVRSTELKTLVSASPKHLKHRQDADEDETSDALAIGSATHMLILEPEQYASDVVVFHDGASRKSAAWDKFESRHVGKTILLAKEVELVKSMSSAVRSDPVASKYLSHGNPEISILWTDEETGIACKARADQLDEQESEHPFLVGIKTARDAGEDKFSRDSGERLYHLSWAMYAMGYQAVRGVMPEMVEIVVEKKAPWDVVVYHIDDVSLGAGMAIYREGLALLKECRASGVWPGQGMGGVRELRLKPWAKGMPRNVELDWS